MFDSPSQRPEHFSLNPYSPLSEGLVFAGLGGGGCAGSLRYEDSSGYGNHGTLTSMDPPTDWVWVPELGRWCVGRNVTGYKIVTTSTLLATTFTLSLWAMELTTVSYGAPISNRNTDNFSGAGTTIYYLSNAPKCRIQNSEVSISSALTLGTWHHLAANYNGTTLTTYVDGQQYASSSIGAKTSTMSVWTLFQFYGPPASYTAFKGKVSDALVFNRVLSPSEIQQLADPSNHMLSGLILQPKRKYYRIFPTTSTNYIMQKSSYYRRLMNT